MNDRIKMIKEFNTTGTCIPHMHYMSERPSKINELVALVEKRRYFTINRPRQYGKTTTMYLLEKELKKRGYLAIRISFEGIDSLTFSNVERFTAAFIKLIYAKIKEDNKELADFLLQQIPSTTSLNDLSNLISVMIGKAGKEAVLQIDEVDDSGSVPLFLKFLGMLRAKYLSRNEGDDTTFLSVILAGVHDVKNLKSKIRSDSGSEYNSPWNIAIDFEIDLSLSQEDIAEMLTAYSNDTSVSMDIPFFSRRLFYYTSGYPFLVSYLCKIIVEKILPGKPEKEWREADLEKALQMALVKDNTNFQSLTKNLANNQELYEFVFSIVMHEQEFSYNPHNEVMNFGFMYGILREENRRVRIHNRLYEQMIYNYMVSKLETSGQVKIDPVGSSYIQPDGSLNIEKVIRKFQIFMKEQYSVKDESFIERNGRLLFLTFLKPIINGKGFDFKEVQISEEKRLDVVVTYGNQKYIIELKKWYGEKAHKKGLEQLAGYLELQNQEKGYLLIFDSRKENNQSGESETVSVNSREILVSWV